MTFAPAFPRIPARLALAMLGAASLSAPALAQVAPTREELDPSHGMRAQGAGASRLRVDGGVERGPCPLADPAYASVKVTFGHVTFSNLTAIDPAALDSTWQDMAGREVPVASLCEVRDRAATMLRQMGYLAAVQVPPQRIDKGGDVRMDVLVAKLVDVQVRGDAGHAEQLIAAHLKKLTAQPFFNVQDAERHLLLLRDLPGFDVRLSLRPAGAAPGEVVGDVTVRRRPVEVVAAVQNLGSTAIGREGGFVQVAFNDLTGLGDRTTLSIYNTVQTREQTVLQASHEFAIGSDGLRLGARFVYGRTHPDVASGGFRSRSMIGQLDLSYPLVRSEAHTLVAVGGMEVVGQTVDFGTTRLNRDKLSVLYGRLDFDGIDKASLAGQGGYSIGLPRWRFGGSLEARLGTGLFGASHACNPLSLCTPPNTPISNVLADPRAVVLRAQANFEFRPSHELTFALAPRAQYADKALLGYEQFSLGNYTIGRGFDPGTVQGDKGIGAAFEVRYGKLSPRSTEAVAVQPYVFLDTAWAWNNDNGITPRRHLWSAGGGLRGRWGDHADLNLTVAAPLDRTLGQTKLGSVRVLFTLTTRLVPWN